MTERLAGEAEYREALYQAQRALMHASKWLQGNYAKDPDGPGARTQIMVNDALGEVSRVLDIGRDESDEMVLT